MRFNYIDELYYKSLRELEEYCYYCLRCLYRAGITPRPDDFARVTFERNNGTIAEAVVYPVSACIDGEGVVNPMFFYGFKWDYDFKDLNNFIKVTFTESYKELKK